MRVAHIEWPSQQVPKATSEQHADGWASLAKYDFLLVFGSDRRSRRNRCRVMSCKNPLSRELQQEERLGGGYVQPLSLRDTAKTQQLARTSEFLRQRERVRDQRRTRLMRRYRRWRVVYVRRRIDDVIASTWHHQQPTYKQLRKKIC